MLIAVSWGGGEEMVEVDAACRSVAALRHTLAAALPEVDAAKVRLEVGGRAVDDDAVCSLCEGCVVAVFATPAARAAAALRERGHAVDLAGFCRAAEVGDLRACGLYLDAEVVVVPDSGCPDTTPLHVACRQGNFELCELLVGRNCPLEVEDENGDRPLHVAIDSDAEPDSSIELCKLLIEHHCSLDAPDSSGCTPLHLAIRAGFVEFSKLLIARGCRIDLQEGWGYTPLHLAVRRASVELCKLLIDNGAALDLRDIDGNTPLHEAVCSECVGRIGSASVGRLLLESGAAYDLVNEAGYTPLTLAWKDTALNKLLTEREAGNSAPSTQ